MGRGQNFLFVLVSLLAACFALSTPARAYEPRVDDEFFGISAPDLYTLSGESRNAELDARLTAIKAAGLDWVRAEIGWADIEPTAPINGSHAYNWTRGDRFVRSLAAKGLTVMPMLMATPSWARSPAAVAAGCGRNAGVSPLASRDYAAFSREVIRRYGPGGAFWSANPSLPYRPITRVELFNEPNWRDFWCPGPDPTGYALAVKAAADAIHSIQPDITVVAGGLVTVRPGDDVIATGQGLEVEAFLTAMTAAAPGVQNSVDAVAVHLYHPDPDVDIGLLGWFRSRLDAAGFDQAEMMVSEFGWRTGGGGPSVVSEEARAALYAELTAKFARTDCGIVGIAAHNWTSPEANGNDPEHWYGIADPGSGELYPSGVAYRDAVALYEGRGPTPAPRETIPVCGGAPPDSDDDGVPDDSDDYPIDPTRSSGSGEEPPLPPAPPEPNFAPRVADGFFRVSIAELPWEIEPRRLHLESIADVGIQRTRAMVNWSNLQPVSGGAIRWDETDTLTLQLALRGMGVAPYVGTPPAWAVNSGDWRGAYLSFLRAYARRYAAGGSFWAENKHLPDELAPSEIEITPVGNSQTHWWQGTTSPGAYADLLISAQAALTEISPGTEAIGTLFDEGDKGTAAGVLRAMEAERPAVRGAVNGVYVYSDVPTQTRLDGMLASVRDALDETGNESAGIHVGFGWNTRGSGAVDEAERARRLAEFVSRTTLSDCGIESVVPYAWMTGERTDANRWEWYGMSGPADASLTPTGEAYKAQIDLFTGFAPDAPPRATVHICDRPEPDRDGDGHPDPVDDYPTDPERFDGEPPGIKTALVTQKRGSRVTLTFDVADRSAVGAPECKLDGRPWASCTSPHSLKALSPGRHVLTVAVSDKWGNRGEATERWRTRR